MIIQIGIRYSQFIMQADWLGYATSSFLWCYSAGTKNVKDDRGKCNTTINTESIYLLYAPIFSFMIIPLIIPSLFRLPIARFSASPFPIPFGRQLHGLPFQHFLKSSAASWIHLLWSSCVWQQLLPSPKSDSNSNWLNLAG